MSDQVVLTLGLYEPSVSEQLKGRLTRADLAVFDRDNVAISRLLVRGLLTGTEAHKARTRLVKRIQATVKKGGK